MSKLKMSDFLSQPSLRGEIESRDNGDGGNGWTPYIGKEVTISATEETVNHMATCGNNDFQLKMGTFQDSNKVTQQWVMHISKPLTFDVEGDEGKQVCEAVPRTFLRDLAEAGGTAKVKVALALTGRQKAEKADWEKEHPGIEYTPKFKLGRPGIVASKTPAGKPADKVTDASAIPDIK